MKKTQIFKLSALFALVVFIVLLALSLFDDFNGDMSEFIAYLGRNASDVSIFLAIVLSGCFIGVSFVLWAFWRTSWVRKGIALLFSLCIGLSYYVYVYYDFLVFDYLVEESPYQGAFGRDQALDAENSLDFMQKYPEIYRDTIGSSYISIDKYRAWLRNNKSRVARNYNVCLQGEQVILTAVDEFFDHGDYCQPETLIQGDRAVKLVFNPIGDNQYQCDGCDAYLLPVFWNHYPDSSR